MVVTLKATWLGAFWTTLSGCAAIRIKLAAFKTKNHFFFFRERFGVIHVNFSDPDRKRTLKDSAYFLKEFYLTRLLPPNPVKNYYTVHGV